MKCKETLQPLVFLERTFTNAFSLRPEIRLGDFLELPQSDLKTWGCFWMPLVWLISWQRRGAFTQHPQSHLTLGGISEHPRSYFRLPAFTDQRVFTNATQSHQRLGAFMNAPSHFSPILHRQSPMCKWITLGCDQKLGAFRETEVFINMPSLIYPYVTSPKSCVQMNGIGKCSGTQASQRLGAFMMPQVSSKNGDIHRDWGICKSTQSHLTIG